MEISNKPITRRQFLKFCAKTFVAAAIWSLMPLDFSFAKDDAGKKKFYIKVKPFKTADLYDPHQLAG